MTANDYRWASRARDTIARPPTPSANVIRLGGGLGFPAQLPDIVSEAVTAAELRSESLQYGPLFGLDDLRDAVVGYLEDDGIIAERDNILIVNGAKQGLDLACRVFMEKGDTIIVSSPTYLTAVSILKTHEVNFLCVGLDEHGMRVGDLEARLKAIRQAGGQLPKLLFEVPDFHNPTGVTLSEERRRHLLVLAREYGFRILEDDPYRRIRFEGSPIAPIKSFDFDGHVIGLGTVSKILAPGLRIGWINADVEIVRRMAAQKSDYGTNPFIQRIVAQLFANGKVDDHIAALTQTLRIHRDVMVDGVNKHLPGSKVKVPKGGYFLWVELPAWLDGEDLTRLAVQQGVEIFAGQTCFAENSAPNYIRLAYSFCTPDEIRLGLKRLGTAFKELQTVRPNETGPAL